MKELSQKPIKGFHISVFFKDGKPTMEITHDDISMLEALHKLIKGWIS